MIVIARLSESDIDDATMSERECANCGDEVLTLSSRDWCDGCELE